MSQEKTTTIDGKETRVVAKKLTFFDVQAVATHMTHGGLDFSDYWRHAFVNWLHYDPPVSVMDLTPEEGQVLARMLPDPNQVIEWLVFREAKLPQSNNSSTVAPRPTQSNFATDEKGWSTF